MILGILYFIINVIVYYNINYSRGIKVNNLNHEKYRHTDLYGITKFGYNYNCWMPKTTHFVSFTTDVGEVERYENFGKIVKWI